MELFVSFARHLGPRFDAAGLRIQFHYNQEPGIHFRVPVSEWCRPWIEQGLKDGLARRFPRFPPSGALWVLEVVEDEVSSSPAAFYRVAVSAIEQAYVLVTTPLPVE